MNEFVDMVDKFNNLSAEEKEGFMKFHQELKHEFRVLSEENNILKESIQQFKEDSQ